MGAAQVAPEGNLMAYCTAAQVKTYLGVSGAGDDTLIGDLITRAQAWIDSYTGRTFEASTNSTRRFTVNEDTDGAWLYFDEDIASITTVTNLADATSTQTISSTEYVTFPRNQTPYVAIRILDSASKEWDYSADPEMGVTVAGKWAYSTAAPNDIVHGCVRLASYLYRQKDSQVFNTTSFPEAGVVETPGDMPPDIAKILDQYRRRVEW